VFGSDPSKSARKALQAAFIGHLLHVEKRECDWWLSTEDRSSGIAIGTFWRLRDDKEILVSVEDDGHQFGLPAPVDVQHSANALLSKSKVMDLHVYEATGDLNLVLHDGVSLDIVVTSFGYECWQAYRITEPHSGLIAFGASGGRGFRK
jgi:hypothetical protein